MTIVKWGAFFVACIINGYCHLQYAYANYPRSRLWQFLLFITGFFGGTLVLWGLIPGYDVAGFFGSMIVGGIPAGLISLWWFPQKMQTIVPKK